ncbi:hypothetical protein [Gordonia sp. ABSL49_1]|uniref:TY-Chap domain-containing protein n=1 Tax=Gordonia sp. ABSL49_1 TaxID=2920941 RepID=UPI001F0DFF29|nr:hypothetical protein [Gordonia sp. ABSL49_1]MCH5642284.1 hypothetical protein [Gordonia sp. ABSL49_1]
MTGANFDTLVDDAWRTFRNDLADRLSTLPVGGELTVAQSDEFPEGPHGVITFTVTRAHRVRATVQVTDLHSTREFWVVNVKQMQGANWRLLNGGRLIYEVSRRRVDELAHLAVWTLREIWEVVHPAMLADAASMPREASLAIATVPDSRDHLLRCVIEVISDIAGQHIQPDADGDIALPTNTAPSWLRVLGEEPTVELFTTLVDEVPDTAKAAEYVATESVHFPGVKLVLHETSVMAFMTVNVRVFHRVNLVNALGCWFEFMTDSAPEVISAITHADNPSEPEDGNLPDPLQTLVVLDDDGTSLSAHEVAVICDQDQSAILDYIRVTQQQSIEWSKSAAEAEDAGDAEEAAACRHEEQVWRATTEQLRAALRLVVLGGPATITRKVEMNPNPTQPTHRQHPRSLVLTNRHDSDGTVFRVIELDDNGALRIEGHDIGRGVERFFGHDEYEFTRTFSTEDTTRLRTLLGLNADDDLLTTIAQRFGDTPTLEQFLTDSGIEGTLFNRIG